MTTIAGWAARPAAQIARARRDSQRTLSRAERTAERERAATASPRPMPATRTPKSSALLAARRDRRTAEYAQRTAEFAYNPLQWRNPENGRWIDMPGGLFEKLGSLLDGIGADSPLRDQDAPMHDLSVHGEDFGDAINVGDTDAAFEAVDKISDDLDNLAENVDAFYSDPDLTPEELSVVQGMDDLVGEARDPGGMLDVLRDPDSIDSLIEDASAGGPTAEAGRAKARQIADEMPDRDDDDVSLPSDVAEGDDVSLPNEAAVPTYPSLERRYEEDEEFRRALEDAAGDMGVEGPDALPDDVWQDVANSLDSLRRDYPDLAGGPASPTSPEETGRRKAEQIADEMPEPAQTEDEGDDFVDAPDVRGVIDAVRDALPERATIGYNKKRSDLAGILTDLDEGFIDEAEAYNRMAKVAEDLRAAPVSTDGVKEARGADAVEAAAAAGGGDSSARTPMGSSPEWDGVKEGLKGQAYNRKNKRDLQWQLEKLGTALRGGEIPRNGNVYAGYSDGGALEQAAHVLDLIKNMRRPDLAQLRTELATAGAGAVRQAIQRLLADGKPIPPSLRALAEKFGVNIDSISASAAPPQPALTASSAASTTEQTTERDPAYAPETDPYRSTADPFALTASATRTRTAPPVAPPAEWFSAPDLDGPTPLTVSDTGRVFGHLATWDTCHIANPAGEGVCVTPPRSASNYAYFHTGAITTANGQSLAVGHLTMDTMHASPTLAAAAAAGHYDNTGLAIADVRAGEDQFGIWVAGAMRPATTPEQVRTLRSSPLSGDWRRVGGNLELTAALAVNTPGFPIPRPSGLIASAFNPLGTNDENPLQSLTAAGMLAPRKVPNPASDRALSAEDYRYLKRLLENERTIERSVLADRAAKAKAAFAAKRQAKADAEAASANREKVAAFAAKRASLATTSTTTAKTTTA